MGLGPETQPGQKAGPPHRYTRKKGEAGDTSHSGNENPFKLGFVGCWPGKGELSCRIASWWPGLHQPMVPFHLHKGVGWAREENPCICNHLLHPMATDGLPPALPRAGPPPWLRPRVRPDTQSPGSPQGPSLPEFPLSADPSRLPLSQESLRQSADPHWAPHPCQGRPRCPLTPALSLPSSPHPRTHWRSVSQPTQGHGPCHRSATTATSGTRIPPAHSTLVAPGQSCTNCHPQSHQHRTPINKSHLGFLHMPSPCG